MVKMIELDHRFVVVGGLIVACLFYQVPLITVAAVFACGCAVYVRNRYRKGHGVALGLTGFPFMRQTRSVGRLRTPKTPPNTSRTSASPASGPRLQTWGSNLSWGMSPVSPCYSQSSGYISLKMLQARRNLGSPKTPELGPRRPSTEGPRFLQKLIPGSQGCKPDMTSNKSDTSYNDICQAKYVGVGVYPVVHLKPSLPVLLNNFNSTMTKSRVTVKVAARENDSFQKLKLQNLQYTSTDSYSTDSNMVIDSLKGVRKRSLKENASESVQKRLRVEKKPGTQSFTTSPGCFLPNGIDHCFNRSLCDESMQILPPHFESEHCILPTPLKPQQPRKRSAIGRDSIESSYSSSKKMSDEAQRRRLMKRKPIHDSFDMPVSKISRSGISCPEMISPAVDAVPEKHLSLSIETSKGHDTEDRTPEKSKTPKANDNLISHSSLDPKPRISPLLELKSSSSIYIPSYIPTMDDYLQDKILNEQKLQHMLNAIAGKGHLNKDYDAVKLQTTDVKESSVEPGGKASESELHLPAPVTVASSGTASAFSFGKTSFTDSATSSLAKSDTPVVSDSAPIILPSENLATILQTPSVSTVLPTSSLNTPNLSTSNATTTASFPLLSALTVPTTSILSAVTTPTMDSSTPTLNSPFSTTFVTPLAQADPLKPSPDSLVTPSPFGQITSFASLATTNTSSTTAPIVPFSASFKFGNAVSTSVNTSTVASVTNPLFSFGSSAPTSAVPDFSAGASLTSFGVSAPSLIPSFSMIQPTTAISSMPSSLGSVQTGTSSTGVTTNATKFQTENTLNGNDGKVNATSGMTLASTTPNATMSAFGALTSHNNASVNSSAPSLFNALGSKTLVAISTSSNSPLQQGVNSSSQSSTGGFAFGVTQNVPSMTSTSSMFATATIASQGFNQLATSQALTFGGLNTTNSTSNTTSTPFAFGSGTSTMAFKPLTGGQLGKNEGAASSSSSIFGANTAILGASNAGFGASNAGFGVNSGSFGAKNSGLRADIGSSTSIASFGASNVGSGASNTSSGATNAGFGGTNAGFVATNASSGATNASSGATNAVFGATNAGFGATNAGFGATNAGFGATNAGFGATNAGFGATNAGFGATNAGFGATNAGFGATNAGLGASNASFGASNAIFGASKSGLGASNAGFGANSTSIEASGVGIGASGSGFGASDSGFGASGSGFGASGSGFGASGASFGASNAGFGATNVGFGGNGITTGFGGSSINGTLPPSYSSSTGNNINKFVGGNTSQAATGGFNFGNAATTSTTVFGSSSVVPTSSSFQFNGQPLNQPNTNLFSSPSNNNENNNTSFGSPFTLKNQPTQAASNQGFSFNPGAQPSFNFGSTTASPSPASMFSIGSGNAARKASSRQRTVR